MIETISQKIVKARKEHKCSWCHGIIEAGEEYENYTFKSPDHGIYVRKNHKRCRELADGLDMWMHGWDGLGDDEFAECIQEYLQENNWFRDDVDMSVEGSLYKDEKFEDWLDGQDWGSETLKAYEIFKNKEKGLAKSFIQKDRATINIKGDKSLDDVKRFIWADNDEGDK